MPAPHTVNPSTCHADPPDGPLAATTILLGIDSIIVGQRHRRDLGDIDGLAANIRDIGCSTPSR